MISKKKHWAETSVFASILFYFWKKLLLPLLPNPQELILENRHHVFVAVPSVPVMMLLAAAFLLVAAFLHAALAAGIEVVDDRADLAKVEGVEGVFEQDHLRLRPVAFAPQILPADDGAGARQPILVADMVQSHRADELVRIREGYSQHDVSAIRDIDPVDELELSLRRNRTISLQELRDFRIVYPPCERRSIFPEERAEIYPSPHAEYDAILVYLDGRAAFLVCARAHDLSFLKEVGKKQRTKDKKNKVTVPNEKSRLFHSAEIFLGDVRCEITLYNYRGWMKMGEVLGRRK